LHGAAEQNGIEKQQIEQPIAHPSALRGQRNIRKQSELRSFQSPERRQDLALRGDEIGTPLGQRRWQTGFNRGRNWNEALTDLQFRCGISSDKHFQIAP